MRQRTMFFLRNMSLRTKLVVAFIALITIPLVIFGFRYFTISKTVISDIVQKNVYELVKKSNENIDTKLSQVTENILSFTIDKDLYSAFATIKPDNDYDIKLLSDQVSKVMNKYFSHSLDIYSAQLATSYYTFGSTTSINAGPGKNFIPLGGFKDTKLYQIAYQKDGKLQWVPTYEFSDMFKVDYMKDVNIDYRYLFSAVQLINGSYFDGSNYNTFESDIEKPVLIVNFKEDFFQKAYRNIIPIKGSYFMVVSKENELIAHQDEAELSKKTALPWMNELIKKGSGTETIKISGRNMIVCFDTSKVTGWLSIVAIPPEGLLGEILVTMKTYLIALALILMFVSIFISYFVTFRITKPIQTVMKAFKKTGEGNFDLFIKEEGSNELRVLIQKYNEMNSKIQKLINENYEIAIKEKEAEINALNLQLDPHFMYNTLNLINLISIENGQDEISEMIVSLSTMLKYTVKSSKELATFKQDFEYLKSYIFIMTKRFEGRYQIKYDVDADLFTYGVPKFFMQPFVENTFLHAFDSFKQGGILKISCWISGDTRFFCIEDNGKGMLPEQLEKLLLQQNSIGIYNVIKRIKIIYGEDYGVRIESVQHMGTKVTIELPKD